MNAKTPCLFLIIAPQRLHHWSRKRFCLKSTFRCEELSFFIRKCLERWWTEKDWGTKRKRRKEMEGKKLFQEVESNQFIDPVCFPGPIDGCLNRRIRTSFQTSNPTDRYFFNYCPKSFSRTIRTLLWTIAKGKPDSCGIFPSIPLIHHPVC